MSSRQHFPWRIVGIAWIIPGVVDATDVYLSVRLRGGSFPMWRAVGVALPGWYVWAPLTVLIFRLRASFPLRRSAGWRPIRNAATHVVAAVLACVTHAATLTLSARAFDPTAAAVSAGQSFVFTLIDHGPISLLLYSGILGAAYALDNLRQFRDEQARAADLEARLTRAKLSALRSQLQPHFLFNALNAAVSLVRSEDSESGAKVLTDLAELLRQLLQRSAVPDVSLGEEVAFITGYLDIEKARYRHRLVVDVRVPAELVDAVVPSLVLQPLVENAVRHGIGQHAGVGRILVEASSPSSRVLRLTVRDNGPGFGAGRAHTDGAGIGLRNIAGRLEQLYGNDASLELHDAAAGGAVATIELPLARVPMEGARA